MQIKILAVAMDFFKKVKNSVIFLMNHDIYVADSSLLFQAKSHSYVLDH